MEGFKPFKKVQCFREGGSVQKEVHNFTKRDRKNVEPSDLAQDKKLIKKAFKQHDEAEHDKEPTEIKLKKGGRAKKDYGTVKKFKTGGAVENAYGAKKTDKDIKDIANSKRQKPALLCGGKSVKKMADGGITGIQGAAMQGALPGGQGIGSANDMERRRMMERAKNAMKYLGPSQQSEFVNQGGMNPAPAPLPGGQGAPVIDGGATPQGIPMKKGGKVKKACK
jgi:hypothetical protein